MKNKLFFIFILFILFLTLNVNADMGPKPSITIQIKNIDTTNYIVDLFTQKNDYINLNSPKCSGITDEENEYLYNLNYNGWVSATTRNSMLGGSCKGNKNYTNTFIGNMKVPTEFKIVLINKDTNETKISNKITRKYFKSTIVLNAKTMKAKETNLTKNMLQSILIEALICLFITIITELIIAKFFKILNNWKIILVANIISNLFLSTILNFFRNYITIREYFYITSPTTILLEIIIFIFELLIYLKFMKKVSKKKIIKYTLVANLISYLLSYINLTLNMIEKF